MVMKAEYLIIDNSDGSKSIKCLKCDMVSYHPMDVKEKYCGNCKKFHDDPQEESVREERWKVAKAAKKAKRKADRERRDEK